MSIWQNSNLCWDEEFRVFLQKVKIISITVEVSLPVSISSQERTKQVHRCLSLRGKQPCWTAQAGCQPAGKTKQNWGLCGLCLQIQSSNCSPIICPCESSIPESWATTTQRQTSWSPAHYTQVVQGLEHMMQVRLRDLDLPSLMERRLRVLGNVPLQPTATWDEGTEKMGPGPSQRYALAVQESTGKFQQSKSWLHVRKSVFSTRVVEYWVQWSCKVCSLRHAEINKSVSKLIYWD